MQTDANSLPISPGALPERAQSLGSCGRFFMLACKRHSRVCSMNFGRKRDDDGGRNARGRRYVRLWLKGGGIPQSGVFEILLEPSDF